VVPCYNGGHYLIRAVESLAATSYANLEILVVDDGSSDGSGEQAARLSRQLPSVRALRHPGSQHRGVSASRNVGIAESHGEYVCFLDADDFVYPVRFIEPADILDGRPEVDAVYSRTSVIVEAGTGGRWWDDKGTFGFRVPPAEPELLRSLLSGQSWHTSGILIRRRLIDRTGAFDPDLHIAEDCHLWFRMAACGRIVADSFSSPVSAYVRHSANTYQPELARKVDFLRAVVRARTWARSHASGSIAVFRQEGARYLDSFLVQLFEQRRSDLVRALVLMLRRERALTWLLRPRRLRLLIPLLTLCRER